MKKHLLASAVTLGLLCGRASAQPSAPPAANPPVSAPDGAFVNLGALADPIYAGTGPATITSILKGEYVQDALSAAELGTAADAPWTGAGAATLSAAIKALLAPNLAEATGIGAPADAPATVTTTTVSAADLIQIAKAIALELKNTLPVVQAGSAGTDASATTRPTLPNVGSNFAATGTYANYVLVATVAANPSRANLDVENDSGGQIVVVRDDGTAAAGVAPVNASVFPLAGGAGVGSQGGSYTSTTFKGRAQIYAPAGTAQVAVFQE